MIFLEECSRKPNRQRQIKKKNWSRVEETLSNGRSHLFDFLVVLVTLLHFLLLGCCLLWCPLQDAEGQTAYAVLSEYGTTLIVSSLRTLHYISDPSQYSDSLVNLNIYQLTSKLAWLVLGFVLATC